MEKYFKPGDKVQFKTGGPVMEVAGYLLNEYFSSPGNISSNYVDCFYYDPFRGKWRHDFFNQDALRRIESDNPAWVDNLKEVFSVAQPAILN